MGIEELGSVTSVAQSHEIRDEGARLAKEITDEVRTSVQSGRLNMTEAWVVLIGTVRQIGMIGGMTPGAQLDNIRQLYATAAKGEAQVQFFGGGH